MKTADFDYDLPPACIAQHPAEPRDSARLMVMHREGGALEHRRFSDVGAYLKRGDLLVLNQTRVIPARLFAKKAVTGGKVEILLLRRIDAQTWDALLGGKNLKAGARLVLENGCVVEVLPDRDNKHAPAQRTIRFERPFEEELGSIGHVPLPPYITAPLANPEQYQTVYARDPGSAAAPTAGLHFTPALLDRLKADGIEHTSVTLHIGLDTFLPVNEESPNDHVIHTEWCEVSEEAAERINAARSSGGRIIAVGTTSVRTLETAARAAGCGHLRPYRGATDLFILPGYAFRAVDGIITNFHLPRSTLIMMISAYAGRERILSAYETARDLGYRFYSFGDAMLIL